MKRILLLLIPAAVIVCMSLMTACKKTNEYPSHVVTLSFPKITYLGPQDTTLSRGANWADPGMKWVDTVNGVTGVLTGDSGYVKGYVINTSVDSAYYLVYTATNKNGFSSTVVRGVGVTNYNGPKTLAGAYNSGSVTISALTRALYLNPNADGYGDATFMVIRSDSNISVATFPTYVTGTTGAPVPESFSQAAVTFQPQYIYTGNPLHLTAEPAVIFSYTVNILNVNPIPGVTFIQDIP